MIFGKKFRQRLFREKPEDTLPFTIHHRRIYILPTKRGCVFVVSLLLMLLASINYSLNLGYALSFLLCGLFTATLLETYKNLSGIRVESVSTNNVFAGERAEFDIGIGAGEKVSRHDIQLRAKGSTNTCSVESDSITQCSLHIEALERGKLSLGRLTLMSRYPLGLWYTWCYVHSPESLVIYPKPETNPPPLPSSALDNSGDKQQKSRSGDVAGLREYQPGDTPSHIAWKSLARGQGLQVKTFEDNLQGGEVLLTLQQTNQHSIESQLSRLSAWVVAAELHDKNYALNIPGTNLLPNSGDTHKTQTLEAIALYGLDQ